MIVEVLRGLSSAFSDTAYTWYHSERRYMVSYDNFVTAFKRAFCSLDREKSIWMDIIARSEDPDETLRQFIINVRGLFESLDSPPTLDEQLDHIYLQMHPQYARELPRRLCSNYQDLLQAAEEVERRIDNVFRYRPPPRPEDCYIPEYAFNNFTKNQSRQPQNHALGAQPTRAEDITSTEFAINPFAPHIKNDPSRILKTPSKVNSMQTTYAEAVKSPPLIPQSMDIRVP